MNSITMSDTTPATATNMTAVEYLDWLATQERRGNKYGAVRTTVDGITFDSAAEARRWSELRLREQACEIVNLMRQRRYRLVVNEQHICDYLSDFEYDDLLSGQHVTEDVKGKRTPMYRIKAKLLLAVHGVRITEVG